MKWRDLCAGSEWKDIERLQRVAQRLQETGYMAVEVPDEALQMQPSFAEPCLPTLAELLTDFDKGSWPLSVSQPQVPLPISLCFTRKLELISNRIIVKVPFCAKD